ncbi:MAG: cell wall-binding repeat-containing protein [Lachnospiraceae bacterium]|nr:cell wall-binding repeat-containing protein [Lachnospiraceae bacterium]
MKKRKMTRRLSLLLVLVLLLGLLPAMPVMAADRGIWLNGVNVLENPYGTGQISGYYQYDEGANRLTLSNYQDNRYDTVRDAALYINHPGLTLVVDGVCGLEVAKSTAVDRNGLVCYSDLTLMSSETKNSYLGFSAGTCLDVKPNATITSVSCDLRLTTKYDLRNYPSIRIASGARYNLIGGSLDANGSMDNNGYFNMTGGSFSTGWGSGITGTGYAAISNAGTLHLEKGDVYLHSHIKQTSQSALLEVIETVRFHVSGASNCITGNRTPGVNVKLPTTGNGFTVKAGSSESTAQVVSAYGNEAYLEIRSDASYYTVTFYRLIPGGVAKKTVKSGTCLNSADIAAINPNYHLRYTEDLMGHFVAWSRTPITSTTDLVCYGVLSDRLQGNDRYATCASIVRQAFKNEHPTEAVMVTGKKYPDALTASGFAGSLDIPLLMSGLKSIPAPILQLIDEWGSLKRVYLVGAEFEPSVKQTLANRGIAVLPLAGPDRYATAEALYNHGKNNGLYNSNCCFVATGKTAADALSASTWAYAMGAPMFLVNGSGQLRDSARAAILNGGYQRVYLLGAANVNNDAGLAAAAANGQITLIRLGGADRYETSALINNCFIDPANPDSSAIPYLGDMITSLTVFAAGANANFPDALAGCQLARKLGLTPTFLVSSNMANNKGAINFAAKAKFITKDGQVCNNYNLGNVDQLYFLGAEVALNSDVMYEIEMAARAVG